MSKLSARPDAAKRRSRRGLSRRGRGVDCAGGEAAKYFPKSPTNEKGLSIMDSGIESLVQFCIAQRRAFDIAAWFAKFEDEGEAVALAAKYLSMTSWYGHEAELEEVAAATHVFADNSNGLHLESQAVGFDLNYFSTRVRIGIAQAGRVSRLAKRVDIGAPPELSEWPRKDSAA
jgi:hypothetical protein